MSKKFLLLIIPLLLLAIYAFWGNGNWPFGKGTLVGSSSEAQQLENLAQCLTRKGTIMYGAYWCSHCKNQKKMFGDAWDRINYIECAAPGGKGQTKECQDAGIKGYPTWVFHDGARLEGEQGLDMLAEKAGCPYEGE